MTAVVKFATISPMSKVQKISIAVTPEMNAMIQEAVQSGQFASSSEVVRDALRFWKRREEARQEALAHTRALIQEGIDSGPGRELDFDELKAEMHAEFERRQDARRVA
jgi:antitoxin ParD1/3/4